MAGGDSEGGSLCTLSQRQPSSPNLLSSFGHPSALHAVVTLHSGRSVVCGDDRGRYGLGRWGRLRDGEVAFKAGAPVWDGWTLGR